MALEGNPPIVVSGCEENDESAAIICGIYYPFAYNHARPAYRKYPNDDLGHDVEIYYWDFRDGVHQRGWWFGLSVGDDKVFGFHPSKSLTPPSSGWRAPWDDPIDDTISIENMDEAQIKEKPNPFAAAIAAAKAAAEAEMEAAAAAAAEAAAEAAAIAAALERRKRQLEQEAAQEVEMAAKRARIEQIEAIVPAAMRRSKVSLEHMLVLHDMMDNLPGKMRKDMVGMVKMCDFHKGFGFIQCKELPFDVYFRDNKGMNPEKGAVVDFTLRLMPDGRPQAQDIRFNKKYIESLPVELRPGGVVLESKVPEIDFLEVDKPEKKPKEKKPPKEPEVVTLFTVVKEPQPEFSEIEIDLYKANLGDKFGNEGNEYDNLGMCGEGRFSMVYKCKNEKDGQEYALKIVSKDEVTRKMTEKEVQRYKEIAKTADGYDPEGAKHLMTLTGPETFDVSGHMCLVFHFMRCDMRKGLRKFGMGDGKGLHLRIVQLYGRQIFLGLRVLRKMQIVHTDVRPENLLLTKDKGTIKICDLGSAIDVNGVQTCPNAQPPYYCAPEVILGKKYGCEVDIWSAGATISELATNQVLFEGQSSNAMLRAMMDGCGAFSPELVKDGKFASRHFLTGVFLLHDTSGADDKPKHVPKPLDDWKAPPKPVSDVLKEILKDPPKGKDPARHMAKLEGLIDVIVKCTHLDPALRITPEQGLELPVLNEVLKL